MNNDAEQKWLEIEKNWLEQMGFTSDEVSALWMAMQGLLLHPGELSSYREFLAQSLADHYLAGYSVMDDMQDKGMIAGDPTENRAAIQREREAAQALIRKVAGMEERHARDIFMWFQGWLDADRRNERLIRAQARATGS